MKFYVVRNDTEKKLHQEPLDRAEANETAKRLNALAAQYSDRPTVSVVEDWVYEKHYT